METTLNKTAKFKFPKESKGLIVSIVSTVFVMLFTYTAVSKIITYDKFVWVLGMSPYIGNMSTYVAWIIPVVELIISGLLIFEKTRRNGLILSLVLMVIFTLYLIFMVSTVSKLPCTCGGVISRMSWNQHIGFNIFLIALSLFGLWNIKKY